MEDTLNDMSYNFQFVGHHSQASASGEGGRAGMVHSSKEPGQAVGQLGVQEDPRPLALWLTQPSPTPRFCTDGSKEQNQNYMYICILSLQSGVGRRWWGGEGQAETHI